MEKNVYTIPEENRAEIVKLVSRFTRKAEKYGKMFSVSYGNPYATKRDYIDNETGKILESELVEVFDLTVETEEIKNDGYSVVARLEHLENGNFVTNFTDDRNIAWNSCPPCCEHCMTGHYRRFTYILRDEQRGQYKQVGSTCLMDFCGINPEYIIAREKLQDILVNSKIDSPEYGFREHSNHVYDFTEILALSVQITEKYGYVKSDNPGSNKSRLIEHCKEFHAETYMEKAREIVEALRSMDMDTAFMNLMDNVKTLAENGYCKPEHFGYIAYCPTAYKRYMEKVEAEKAREAELEKARVSSDYVGNIGERLVFEIRKAELVTSWETQYGFTMLYKFEDVNGNILVWYASSGLSDKELATCRELKATVKDHSERNGIKQTIITRAKVA